MTKSHCRVGAVALMVLFACGEHPNPAEVSAADVDAPSLSELSGADITRFPTNGANTGSVDGDRGLFAIHYVNTESAQAAWEGNGVLDPSCDLPEAPATIDLMVVDTPSGRITLLGSGEVHVVVFRFTGTIPLTCDDLVAEGRVDFQSSFNNFFPGLPEFGPGRTVVNFKSHGTITSVPDGSDVRLNWTFQFSIPPSGINKTSIELH